MLFQTLSNEETKWGEELLGDMLNFGDGQIWWNNDTAMLFFSNDDDYASSIARILGC